LREILIARITTGRRRPLRGPTSRIEATTRASWGRDAFAMWGVIRCAFTWPGSPWSSVCRGASQRWTGRPRGPAGVWGWGCPYPGGDR
jgi:hypothetical protein